jgi:hypothetical protein
MENDGMNDTTAAQFSKTQKRPPQERSTKNTSPRLVQGVTAENYTALAKGFMEAGGGAVLALKETGIDGETRYEATPRQWGSWRAYFKAKSIKTNFMDMQAKAGKPWTVPAPWPHEFDAEATVQADHEAGESFMRNYRPENPNFASEAQRVMTVRNWRKSPKGIPYFRDNSVGRVYNSEVKTEKPMEPHHWVKPEGYWTDPNFDRAAL